MSILHTLYFTLYHSGRILIDITKVSGVFLFGGRADLASNVLESEGAAETHEPCMCSLLFSELVQVKGQNVQNGVNGVWMPQWLLVLMPKSGSPRSHVCLRSQIRGKIL